MGRTLADVLQDAAAGFPHKAAIVDGGLRLTFAQLKAQADQLSKALLAIGLQAGERFSIWAPNMAQWVVAALAGQQIGGVLVPINTRFKGGEAADIVRRSGAKLAFAVADFLGTDYADLLARQDCPTLERIVLLNSGSPSAQSPTETTEHRSTAQAVAPSATRPLGHADAPATETDNPASHSAASSSAPSKQSSAEGGDAAADRVCRLEDFARLGEGVQDAALAQRIAAVQPDDLSDILYTSGTTGAPKGAMTSHGQNIATFVEWSAAVGLNADDRYLIVNPFFHSFGYKAGWLAALLHGATIYPQTTFDAGRLLQQVERHRITLLPGPPTVFQSLLTHPALAAADLSSLRCAVTGAASVPVQLVKDMKHRLGFAEVYTAYGLTESSGVVSLCRSGDDFETIANTCGRAMRGVEVKIAGGEGQALPPGERGEVWVRGFNVMRGYLDDPAATAAAITADGWLKTGDLGVLDGRGYLKIVDRLKDMYICGGFNCYPAEIENQLLDHPDIAEAAVIGAADDRLGEVGHLFAVRTPASALTEEALITWARERMANYKVPRRVTWREQLPRNASGKVRKFLLGGG